MPLKVSISYETGAHQLDAAVWLLSRGDSSISTSMGLLECALYLDFHVESGDEI